MKILNCILALSICAVLASCRANDSSSGTSRKETRAQKTTTINTNSQADNKSETTRQQAAITGSSNPDHIQ